MMREISRSPLRERSVNCVQRPAAKAAKCSALDSVETKENSAVKAPQVTSPLQPRRLNFQESLSAPKPLRRVRSNASTHMEKRFKGTRQVFPKMALELQQPESHTSVFFRCYRECQVAEGLPGPPESTQDDDCATDEESAQMMSESLLEVLSAAIVANTN